MFALVNFLRFFSWIFGLTSARAEDEKKYAVLLLVILAAIAVISGVTIWFVLRFLA
jgi:hypothetical protein